MTSTVITPSPFGASTPMPANRMRRAAERTLRRHAVERPAGPPGAAVPPALLAPDGARVDPAALLDRRGERLWLLAAPGTTTPGPLPWLHEAAWRRAAADPGDAQRPVLVDLARPAADGPVTAGALLRALDGAATAGGYLLLLDGLDTAGGAVRAAVAGVSGPLARRAPASTVIAVSHAEPVRGFHIPALFLPDPIPQDPIQQGPPAGAGDPPSDGAWDALAERLRTRLHWPAGLLAAVVAACAGAGEELRRRIIDDLAALGDRRLLFRAALAAGGCDDDGVRRAASTEIEALAGTSAAARDASWVSRLLAVLDVLDGGAHRDDDAEAPAGGAVLLRMAATGRAGSAPLTILARRDPDAAIAAAERTTDPLDLDAVARAADEPAVVRAVLARRAVYPPWETALAYRAQLQPGVAVALLREPGRDTGPVTAGRWQAFPATRGSAYGRLLDDVLARPWAWPPHAAPLLFTLSGVRPPASQTPVLLAALPRAGAGAVVAALAVLACGRLAAEHVTAAVATAALIAGVAVAGANIALRLRQWRAAVAARLATPLEAAVVPCGASTSSGRCSGSSGGGSRGYRPGGTCSTTRCAGPARGPVCRSWRSPTCCGSSPPGTRWAARRPLPWYPSRRSGSTRPSPAASGGR
ncbi:hypothetical protein [Dactylosporangium darangshiense]|uniref:hypothetical protein n=1 Tax=Dactylosporangium darangshiense TaxID=579108 RepID=UPI003636A930